MSTSIYVAREGVSPFPVPDKEAGTAFDYITVTSNSWDFYDTALSVLKRKGVVQEGRGRAGGYRGYAGDAGYVGWNGATENQRGYAHRILASFWGKDTLDSINQLYLYEHNHRVTRFDLQRTIELRACYPLISVYEYLVQRNTNASLLRGDTFTLTLGSRKSERYFRLYEKNVDDAMFLRLELEVKGLLARKAFEACVKYPDARTALLQASAKRFPDMVQSDFFGDKAQVTVPGLLREIPESDKDTYLEYVETAIRSLVTKRELALRQQSWDTFEKYERFRTAMEALIQSGIQRTATE